MCDHFAKNYGAHMPRQVLTDVIWMQLERTMRFHGCHKWSNDRVASWRDIPKELGPWKTASHWQV